MADRFDKFTERARKVLQLAQEEAQRFNHNYIGTEHLLLGLVREGEGIAAGVLESLGVSLDRVRAQVIHVLSQSSSYTQHEARQATRTPTIDQMGIDLTAAARSAAFGAMGAPASSITVGSGARSPLGPGDSSGRLGPAPP